jgi:hypothetical protein
MPRLYKAAFIEVITGTIIHHPHRRERRSMAISKSIRLQVYKKYDGHCAYCGKAIEFRDMQVDHIIPRRTYWAADKDVVDHVDNLNPSCRRCNHYKRADSLKTFRKLMLTLHERVQGQYICKVAEDYGIIKVEPWDGRFYFEKHMSH